MQALDIAAAKIEAASTPAQQQLVDTNISDNDSGDSEESEELGDVLLEIIKKLDQGDGVDFETLIISSHW